MTRLSASEATAKIEIKVPASLKAAALQAAQAHGDGDVSSWVRSLIRAELARLGMTPTTPSTRSPIPPRRKAGR